MRRPLALLAAVLAPCAATLPTQGCSSAGAAADASADGTLVLPGGDAGSDDAELDGGPSISTTMRLANMSPDLGLVDFCWRVPGASSFTGPVLGASADGGSAEDAATSGPDAGATDAAPVEASADGPSEADVVDAALDGASDAEAAGDGADEASGSDGAASSDAGPPVQIAFGSMSPFERLPVAGTLDIALVAPNQLSCGQPRFIGRVTLDPGKVTTVAVMGLLGVDAGTESALVMKTFTDEPGGAQTAQLRVIHAALGWRGWPGDDAPAAPLALQVGGTLVVSEVDPTQVAPPSTSPAIDALGYAALSPFTTAAPIQLFSQDDAEPRTWSTAFFQLGLLPGTSHTAFIVNLGGGALGVAWCGIAQFGGLPPTCVVQPAR